MKSSLYNRRYTLFLFSFVLMLFGDIFTRPERDYDAQTVLLLQNMVFSLLLLRRKHGLKRVVILSLLALGTLARINYKFYPEVTGGFVFLAIYLIYFLLISIQIYRDLVRENNLGIEIISAAFSGYILLGAVFSVLFFTLGPDAFKGPQGELANSGYLYFSFITLLTIGYGDIVPVTEIARKVVLILGLMGHFYTVFVIGIIIGKFVNLQSSQIK